MKTARDRRVRSSLRRAAAAAGLAAAILVAGGWPPDMPRHGTALAQAGVIDPLVFVSRAIPRPGHISDERGVTGALPGVGSISRFVVANPGQLLVLEPDGRVRVLVDGRNPTPQNLHLIDVHAPDVSYDGRRITFAGLPGGTYDAADRAPGAHPGAWRIFVIDADGTNLRQVTSTPPPLDLSQFPFTSDFNQADDTDPAWLPDGRIVFSSTRWPAVAQYRDPRTTNLYVVNADGSRLHRITAERNGADRPMVDPLTGRIVYSRWWRNGHPASDSLATVTDPFYGGYLLNLGVSVDNPSFGLDEAQLGTLGPANAEGSRNLWISATVNPDGTGLELWGGSLDDDPVMNSLYGGAFDEQGHLYSNFIPLENLAEVAGFGGIRHHRRGVTDRFARPAGVLGLTEFLPALPLVFTELERVYLSEYAAEPETLPGTQQMVASIAADHRQDYGLYLVNRDGSGRQLLYDRQETTEIRARRLRPRPLPPVLGDAPSLVGETASLLPPRAAGPYDLDGTFVFEALNVYANAPVDVAIVSAPPVGSAGSIRFYADFIKDSPTTNARFNWPALLGERPIAPDGAVTEPRAPANIPLFEQLRTPAPQGYRVPLTGAPEGRGAAHVAGQNFGRPGTVARCVGCHMGHTRIAVPPTAEAARWTNLAPGAVVTASSSGGGDVSHLINRRARTEGSFDHWRSQEGLAPSSQWVQLTFPVPIHVRTVRLYGAGAIGPVLEATVQLFSDAGATDVAAQAASGALADEGTNVPFADVPARAVRIAFAEVEGPLASLAEIEVIAAGGPAGARDPAPGAPKNVRIVR
jgi:hypothetical protein